MASKPYGHWKSLDFGWIVLRAATTMMVKDNHPRTVPIPVHGSKSLPKGTLASIIRMAGVTRQQFFRSLR
jgi:predicted RNA binding protein YcfA (HicA-like mRNA interferase family)